MVCNKKYVQINKNKLKKGNKFKVPLKKLKFTLPQTFYWVFFIIFMLDSENLGNIL